MIIAEFCQNHNGDFGLLSEMIIAAAESGATHGKIQTIFANNVVYRPQFEKGLVENGHTHCIKRPYHDEVARLQGLEISFDQSLKFCELCRSAGLEPVTTCFAREHIPELSDIGFRTIKVASYDCASFQMLRELKNVFDKIIVSTGATFNNEIKLAASILEGIDFAFLHCVTIYPTPLKELHLARMEYLKSMTKEVGFSDHTLVSRDGITGSMGALSLGAEIVERHFSILEPHETKDGPVSINPDQLRILADFARLPIATRLSVMDEQVPDWRQMVGSRQRKLSEVELLNRDYYRGRFASRRKETKLGQPMIYNWEEVPIR